MKLKVLLKKKVILVTLALVLSLFGQFLLPPHIEGTYIPLFSLLLLSDIWCGEADGVFYYIFFAEWVVYFSAIYCVGRLILMIIDKCQSHRIDNGSA
jgi:hypothetical protein